MTQDIKRQRILDKIRKLQSKTTAMGCTEAEALAAARAVGHLLDAYGLTLSDVELQTTECIEDAVLSPFVTNRHPIRYCVDAIAGYCHTEHFFSQRPTDVTLTTWRTAILSLACPMTSRSPLYLTQVIMAAFDREARVFKRTPGYLELTRADKCEAFKSFRYGMAQRIRERLCELKAARERDLEATGRDLVRVVGAVVSQAFRAYRGIRTVGFQERPYDALAYAQGMDAGARVGLHPGVKGGVAPRQLRA